MTGDNFVSRLAVYPNSPLLSKCGKANSSQFSSKITLVGILFSPGAISKYSLDNSAGNMQLSDDY